MKKINLIVTLVLFMVFLSASCSKSSDSEISQLRKEIDELKKEKTARENESSVRQENAEPEQKTKKWVNTDGSFLILRSSPGISEENQIAKIPNKSEVMIGECQKESTKIGDRSGRWCRATYTDKNGWIFDAYLTSDVNTASRPNIEPADSPVQNSDPYHLSKDDMHRIMMAKGIWNFYSGTERYPWIEIIKIGPFNQEQKYWPVRVKLPITQKKYGIYDCRILKDDYGEWVVRRIG